MDSVSDIGEERQGYSLDASHLSRDADRLVSEYGGEADGVAARRADALFRAGDVLGGTRWLKIFRRIALSPFRRAAE